MNRHIPLFTLCLPLLFSCNKDLEEELTSKEIQITEMEQQLADAKASFDLCEKQRDQKVQDLRNICQRVENVADAYHVHFFDANTDDYVDMPEICNPAREYGGDFKVKVLKADAERGWAYLKYSIDGNIKFSDRLVYELPHQDRAVLRIRDQTFSEPVLLFVESCNEKGVCGLGCRVLPYSHLTCE